MSENNYHDDLKSLSQEIHSVSTKIEVTNSNIEHQNERIHSIAESLEKIVVIHGQKLDNIDDRLKLFEHKDIVEKVAEHDKVISALKLFAKVVSVVGLPTTLSMFYFLVTNYSK